MKVREIIKLIEADGWVHIGSKGSHRHYKHSSKPGKNHPRKTFERPAPRNREKHP